MSMHAAAVSMEAPPPWWRFRRWPGRLFDVGVVVALLAVGAAIVITSTNAVPRLSDVRIPTYVAVMLSLASLLVRRRYPLVTIGVIAAAVLAESIVRPAFVFEPLVMVAVYIAASRLPWRTALTISVGLFVLFAVAGGVGDGSASASKAVTSLVALGAAFAVGVYVGTRTAYVKSLHARADQLIRERELLAGQAVAEERVRIARELHDVVAHHLSLITIQAGALRAQVDAESPAAHTAGVIATTGHQAMDEMRRMLGVLRLGAAEVGADHAPQPGLRDVEQLVGQTRAAGVTVTLTVEGEPRQLPPGVELSAYRIVQEALTNVLRHAGPARCMVLVSYGGDRLELRITDDGRGADAAPSNGHGLVGMRERVALFGGEFHAGGVPGGGFAVRATLPVSRAGADE
ncbi:MAG: sensor histidine kinase [Candidatus Dormibacteria bacterium]